MSHREEPRSGRGCFGAVVVVPFLALGGMFALIALTGSPSEAPLAAPAPPEIRVKTLALRPGEPPPADPPRTA